MLQKFMNMGFLIYTMTGITAAGVLLMFLMNAVSQRKIRDKTSYARVAKRIKIVTAVSSVLCILVVAASVAAAFSAGRIRTAGIRHMIAGAESIAVMICFGKFLSYLDRQRLFQEYVFGLIERQNKSEPDAQIRSAAADRKQAGTKGLFLKKKSEKKKKAETISAAGHGFGDKSGKNAQGAHGFGKGGVTAENSKGTAASSQAAMEKNLALYSKNQLVDKAMNGIRESASSGENRFSHMLSDEEEEIMREVIGEFITQGQA